MKSYVIYFGNVFGQRGFQSKYMLKSYINCFMPFGQGNQPVQFFPNGYTWVYKYDYSKYVNKYKAHFEGKMLEVIIEILPIQRAKWDCGMRFMSI